MTPSAVAGCLEACRRMEALARLAASAQRSSVVLPHLRHALEHVVLLLEGASTGVVDYAARRRDPALETTLGFLAGLRLVQAQLETVDRIERLVEVVDVVAPGVTARSGSTLARELAFASSHAIHHLALAASLAGLEAPASLVEAFSTQEHRRRSLGAAS